MSVVSPLVKQWQDKGLIQGKDWNYFKSVKRNPITLAAGRELPFLENEPMLRTPLGSLFFVAAIFTHPECGFRYETTDMDTGDDLQPHLIQPLVNFDPSIQFQHTSLYGGLVFLAGIPTRLYVYVVNKEWVFQKWLNLHLFNTSTSQQVCLAYGLIGAKVFISGARKLGLPEELWKTKE